MKWMQLFGFTSQSFDWVFDKTSLFVHLPGKEPTTY